MRTTLDASSEIFLANLSHAQVRLDRAQRQLSSGLKIQTAADAPDDVAPLLQLRAALDYNGQMQNNLARAAAEAKAADDAISTATKLMDRAVALASQAGSPTATAESRHNIALEIQGIHEQILGLSRTQADGRYIFSGDLDQYPAYDLDLSLSTGVTELTTAWATRRIEDPAGGTFATSRTAREIFDLRNADDSIAGGNVFFALNSLRTALENDDAPAIGNALTAVKRASDHLTTQVAFYGNIQNRVTHCAEYSSSSRVRLQTEISRKEDADITEAALELSQANLQVQTALTARAQARRTSLFDLLG